jgi:D-arabinose 1-dehydrogenase-like Zn-dependent alcohol dehydrogenase
VVLATVTNAAAMSATVDGLGRRGELIIVGVATEPMDITPLQIMSGAKRVYGHASGIAVDTQNTMKFAAQSGVRTWIEEAPLEEADAAFQKMISGQARFRMVLTTGN